MNESAKLRKMYYWGLVVIGIPALIHAIAELMQVFLIN